MNFKLLAFATLLFAQVARAQSGGDFDLSWSTVDGGGGTSSGGDFAINGTIGQPDAGTSSGGSYTLQGGFWGLEVAAPLETPPPLLSIILSGLDAVLSWPAPSSFSLEQSSDLGQTNAWSSVGQAVVPSNGQNTVTLPATNSQLFFRLRR